MAYKIMRNRLKRIYNRFIRNKQEWDSYINLSFAQEGEDLILFRLLENIKDGFYIDVGAHHPYRFSNTFKFYQLGWRGINIDALPGSKKVFDKKRPLDINIEAGISQNEGLLNYYMFNEPALNTFSETLAKDRENEQYYVVSKANIPCYKLSDILEEYLPKNTSIDFMTIDVEGLDLDVLKSNNWDMYKPKYIVVESLNTSLSKEYESPIYSFLKNINYDLIAKTANSLFFENHK